MYKTMIVDGNKTEYNINEYGEIISNYTNNKLTPFIAGRGYQYVHLSINKKKKNIAVHRLVAMTFIPNPDNKPTVNHKDGDKLNNHVSNLEWSTYSEQNFHMHELRKQGKLKKYIRPINVWYDNRVLTENQVSIIIILLSDTDLSCSKIAKKFNVDGRVVHDIYMKKTWKHMSQHAVFKSRAKDTKYSKYRKQIYSILRKNPDIECKDVINQLGLEPDKKLKNLIHNTRRVIKEESSTTIEKVMTLIVR